MRVVLDTCALLAFAGAEPMSATALDEINAARRAGMAFVPTVVALEIGQKWAAGKLRLKGGATARQWYERAMVLHRFSEVCITADMALAAYELPEPFHRDPADRLIVAMARLLRAPVVTIDQRILAYGRQGHVQVVSY
ncbi:MAG: type II toxin-antitoxin system VapC family toxin [Geminicoccaceae bacterium]